MLHEGFYGISNNILEFGEREVPYCANCGKELTPGAAFCPYCGTAVAVGVSPTTVAPQAATTSANYADLSQRIIAAIVDSIIVGIAVGILSSIFVFSGLGMLGSSRMGGVFASSWMWAPWIWLVGLLIPIGYYTYLEGTSGQTIGKKMMKIKVIKVNGSPCDLPSAFFRSILRVVDSLVIGLVGIVVISVTEKRQRVGDIVANTIVVRA